MGICSYCNEDRKLTREHVIPSFLYQFIKSKTGKQVGWNEKAKKVLPSENCIKDVCSICNNDQLGSLDGYAKTFFTENKLLKNNFSNKEITLLYDFNKLHRWILKVLYNSSRASGSNSRIFHNHINYILKNDVLDNGHKLLIVGLLGPEILSESRANELNAKRSGIL